MKHVYKQTESQLWTVGHYDPDGNWIPVKDCESPEAAARETAVLNGSDSINTGKLLRALEIAIDALGADRIYEDRIKAQERIVKLKREALRNS